MIKLEKDLSAVPKSLIPAFEDLFPKHKVPTISRTTHEKRMAVINEGKYNNTTSLNSRYKLNDVRDALIEIYKGKCAFCEQEVEQYHIDHYRPKATYYWLAFSWDNLILLCPKCNENKGDFFELEGSMVTFDNTEPNLRNINTSSEGYDVIELPKMVNPEVTDPLGKITFQDNGLIESADLRFVHTIEKCKINRKELNDKRRTLLNIFREHITVALVENLNIEDQKIAIRTIIRSFRIDSDNSKLDFLAFRKYAISAGWLNSITKEL